MVVLRGGHSMNQDLVSHIASTVEQACKDNSNTFGYGIWSHHIRPMMDIAPELAGLHQADTEIVIVSVLLHDYAGIKDPAMIEDHHIHGANHARIILSAANYPEDRISMVEQSILSHRGSVPSVRTSPESRCLADCDAILHVQQIPSLFYVAYTRKQMDIDAGVNWVRAKIARDWEKLSPAGRDYIRETYDRIMAVLPLPRAAGSTSRT
jgi:uncharacterized protein